MSKISTLVNKVTADNREQAPGFLLQELATKTQSIEDCRVLEDLILSKLQKDKPYIKFKTLKAIKYLCENGAPRWKQSWQSHTDKIRACAQFRGPPDAVYGDSPYENVRQAAKEAMSAIFSSTQKVIPRKTFDGKEGPKVSSFGNETQGITNVPISRAPVVSNNSQSLSHTRPYNPSQISNSGFGNTEYKPKATGFQQHKQQAPYVNPNTFTTEYPHAEGKLKNQTSRGGTKRRKGQVGGEWENENDTIKSNQSMDKDGDHNSDDELTDVSDNPRSSIGSGKQQTVTDGAFERQWVNGITTTGGIGDKIPDLKQKLQQFQNLSQSHVLEFLDEKLADNSSWQVQAKALTLVEGLLNDASAPMVAEYFRVSPENLQGLANSKRVSLKKKATTIAQRIGLGIPNESKSETKRENSAGAEEDAKDDMLQLDSWMSNEIPNQDLNSNQNNLEPETEEAGIFDGLGIANPSTTNKHASSDEIFSGLEINNQQEDINGMGQDSSTMSFNTSSGFPFTSNSTSFVSSQPSSTSGFGFQSSDLSGFGTSQPSGLGSFESQLNNNYGQSNISNFGSSNVNNFGLQSGYGLPQTNYGSSQTSYGSSQTSYGSSQTSYGSSQTNYGSSQSNNGTHGSSNTSAFASLFTSSETAPAVNSTSSNVNMRFLNDPFASVTSQPVQPQQASKNKKGDKDPFAEFALGALQI